MVLKAHEHLAELDPWYAVFIDIVDWRSAALSLLTNVAQTCVALDFHLAPELTLQFLDVLMCLVKTAFLVKEFGVERCRVLTATYYRMYHHHKCAQEPTFPRIAKYIDSFGGGVAALGVECAALFRPLVQLFSGPFTMSYLMSRDFLHLTKDAVFSATVKPELLAVPADSIEYFAAMHYDNLYEWYAYALLACPQLLEVDALSTLNKEVLTKGGFALTLHRNRVVYIHEQLDAICKEARTGKTLSKQRKVVQTYAKEGSIAAFAHHVQARVFIAQAGHALLSLISDVPGVAAPKLGMLLGLARMARYETQWLLMHGAVPAPALARYKHTDVVDVRGGSRLISICVRITEHLRRYGSVIEQYYVEFCSSTDVDRLDAVRDASCDAQLGDMRDALGKGQVARAVNEWRRGQCAAATGATGTATPARVSALMPAHAAAQHAEWAGGVPNSVQEHASPALLWWWHDALFVQFEGALAALDGESPRYALAYVHVCADVPALTTAFYSKERDRLGKESVNQANKLLVKLTKRVCFLLHDIAMTHMRLDHVLADINAVHQVFRTVNRDWKPPKDYQPQPVPGDESRYGNNNKGESLRLRQMQRACFQLCSAIDEKHAIAVFNHAFCPSEYLREKLHVQLVNFMRQCVAADDRAGTIQRPSVLERRVGIYSATLQEVEHYVRIDTGELMRQAFLGEVYAPTCGETGSIEFVNKKPEPVRGSMVAILTDWYADFAAKAMQTAIYSPARKAFASRRGSAVAYEQWTDLEELAALGRVVGPYGVKQLEQRILAMEREHITSLHATLKVNAGSLQAIAKNYFNGPAVADAIKRMKDLDGSVQTLIQLGALQQFRRVLREALGTALTQSVPFIRKTCALSHESYSANHARQPTLLAMDALAADAGVPTFVADPSFGALIDDTAKDDVWELLPYLFAASFSSSSVKDTVFNSSANGHINNVHCAPFAVVDLITHITAARGSSEPRKIRRRLEHLLEVASAQVLRLVEGSKDGGVKGYADLPAVVLLLDAVLVASHPMLDRSDLEKSCPYLLLRQMYTDAYAPRKLSHHLTSEW